MIPRLQMKEPYRFCYDKVHSVDVHRYMSEGGYIAGLATAWKDYVYEMFDHFEADIANGVSSSQIGLQEICDIMNSNHDNRFVEAALKLGISKADVDGTGNIYDWGLLKV